MGINDGTVCSPVLIVAEQCPQLGAVSVILPPGFVKDFGNTGGAPAPPTRQRVSLRQVGRSPLFSQLTQDPQRRDIGPKACLCPGRGQLFLTGGNEPARRLRLR